MAPINVVFFHCLSGEYLADDINKTCKACNPGSFSDSGSPTIHDSHLRTYSIGLGYLHQDGLVFMRLAGMMKSTTTHPVISAAQDSTNRAPTCSIHRIPSALTGFARSILRAKIRSISVLPRTTSL